MKAGAEAGAAAGCAAPDFPACEPMQVSLLAPEQADIYQIRAAGPS